MRIGAHEYKVAVVKDLTSAEGVALHGQLNDDDTLLELAQKQSRTKRQEILLHESLHGCFYGIPDWDEDLEEKFVTTLAPRLVQLLQDNPELVTYLTYRKPTE